MSVITVRIPKKLKEALRKYSNINWSNFVREAISKRIELEEKKEAIKRIDEAKRRVKPIKRGELDKWIKEDRRR